MGAGPGAHPHTGNSIMKKSTLTLTLAGCGLLAAAGSLLAGPLDPPAGPVAPTYKTLAEVEPRTTINATNTPGDNDASPSLYRINVPGSYVLTGNITCPGGKNGIEIAASNVTIDLNGFSIVGLPGSLDGIRSNAELRCVTIRNGCIRGFGDDGMDLVLGGTITGVVIENIQAAVNGQIGIRAGEAAVVHDCTVSGNGNAGVYVGGWGVVQRCAATGNWGVGISVLISGSVRDCVASDNGSTGISVGYNSTVNNCSSYSNDGVGIAGSSSSIIESCTARSNGDSGITVYTASVVRGCTSSANGTDGFGAGIQCFASDTRIEGNTCTINPRGIRVEGAGNIVLRNSCSGNGLNWDLAANNVFGPIIDRSSPGSGAVAGNSAPSSLGSTDPNANFTY